MFYIPINTEIGHFKATSQSLSTVLKKLNLTQQKQTCINKPKDTKTHYKHKGLKPVLVALYDIWPGNRLGLLIEPQGSH